VRASVNGAARVIGSVVRRAACIPVWISIPVAQVGAHESCLRQFRVPQREHAGDVGLNLLGSVVATTCSSQPSRAAEP